MPATLSLNQARRIALAAQGLDKGRPAGPVSSRAVGRTFARLQLVQIDSVNVLSRSHYLPFFSRLGNYDRSILQRMSGTHPRRMMEYWAHEASFIRPELFPDLVLWQKRSWVGAGALDPALREGVTGKILAVLAAGKPLTAAELTAKIGHVEDRRTENWGWNWNVVKRVLEHLFEEGLISAASRSEQFERRYAITERVLPDRRPVTDSRRDPVDAVRRLIDAAAQAHGIGTVRCFADYFRTPVKAAAAAVADLVAAGRLEPVSVAGWDRKVFLHSAARVPRRAAGRALLSPFDSLVFERRRLEELFGFHYRIEIYTPEHRRRYGYYVLPFLLGDRIVARVDLKADRAAGNLLVRSAYGEQDAPPGTAVELSQELELMAEWLGLGDVVVSPVGDLAAPLAAALRSGNRADPLSGNSGRVARVSPVD
ncbi:crosslink repair DNA glycosylase YcaQ family protein [Pseudarthrobacter sp. H3Y2-7]|uniref:winged helix-turn-helix domain-containing protein n=1 Tax=Pseudarthrobacter naphthalenicus TaxID=3031328 RepID=UPI0023AFD538|nr:crosslink repair DNA glycosylase YcaQ family protein [Pseudarthrobacter sp. H3Y2-7]MDE8667337.1 crosslink repair DNA glycosylase YcaQ family protein [Pseudarthrobacter sp. H3Y2-7]